MAFSLKFKKWIVVFDRKINILTKTLKIQDIK